MENQSNVRSHLNGLIEKVKSNEKITKAALSELSRTLITYVRDTHDIDMVNRLIHVLTPMNSKLAIIFFTDFLPFKVEEDGNNVFTRFGKMSTSDKKIARIMKAGDDFLSDEKNDIWTYTKDVKVEKKQKDFAKLIERSVTNALKGDDKSDSPSILPIEVLQAVFKGGISLEDMLAASVQFELDKEQELLAA